MRRLYAFNVVVLAVSLVVLALGTADERGEEPARVGPARVDRPAPLVKTIGLSDQDAADERIVAIDSAWNLR